MKVESSKLYYLVIFLCFLLCLWFRHPVCLSYCLQLSVTVSDFLIHRSCLKSLCIIFSGLKVNHKTKIDREESEMISDRRWGTQGVEGSRLHPVRTFHDTRFVFRKLPVCIFPPCRNQKLFLWKRRYYSCL